MMKYIVMHKIRFKIKETLERQHKTLYWLAKEAGLPYATVYRLAADKTVSISFAVLDKICDALDVEPAELIYRNTKN